MIGEIAPTKLSHLSTKVQCAYNPVVGREALWGANAFSRTYAPKRLFVIGAGPAGLEFARVASGQGNAVVVYEREQAVGGHVRAYGALPYRQQFGSIATWLAEQARGNGSEIKLTSPVTRENIDAIIAFEKPDHVVVASGARYRRDGFQGQTGKPLPVGKPANVSHRTKWLSTKFH
jgi:NADPH-dependent glutamate synthase beta subunit-like oxidoreductase